MIEILDVWKKFGKKWVLKGINLKVKNLTAILGENGSGKTTLLKIACGLLKPNRGTVKVFGFDVRKSYEYKSKIGVLFHENVLYEELTLRENLLFFSKMYGFGKLNDLTKNLLKKLGLEKYSNSKVKNLSHGLKRRANFVRAFLNDPKVILLDEPLAGLDESAKEAVLEIIDQLSDEKTILFTSPAEVEIQCKKYRLCGGVLN